MSASTPARAVGALALALTVVVTGCGHRGDGDPGAGASSQAARSAPSTLEDRPAGPVLSGFVAFGDSGGGPAQQAVADAMQRWTVRHRVDALVSTGDNVYERGEPERFAAQLDRPYAELRRSRPLWVSLGNHDVAAGHGAEQLRHLGLPDHPYAKTLPGVQLLLLDSNRVDQAQADWLERQLAGPGPPLRVVVFHHPAWSCSRHDSTEDVTERWGPVLERHRVALVLNGHDHNYQRFSSPAGVTYVVTGGGGKALYPLDDDCPAGTPPQVGEARRHHFTAVEVRDGSLAVTVIASDDTVLDRTVIRR
jgi:3',5'-cyclic AMP phosphodiesterase CpdA